MTDRVHAMPADAYHADEIGRDRPSLSASVIHTLCTSSPRHAWAQHPKLNPHFEREDDDKFDIGTSAHELLLRGTNIVEVVDADSWRTKAAKEAAMIARAAGKIPLLPDQWARLQAMITAGRQQIAQLEATPPLFTDGEPEQTLIWEDEGVLCRARLDWLRHDLSTVDDYKTTRVSADGETWSRRTLFSIGADIQVAFYLRGLEVLYPEARGQTEWRYVVQETFPPFALSFGTLGEDVLTIGRKKVRWALAVWRTCLDRDEWPAYSTRPWRAELPPWEESRWLEREVKDAA